MNTSIEEVLKYIEDEDARFIRLAFRDAFGIQKNIAIAPGEVKKAFEDGVPIHAREIAGFEDAPGSSLYLRPDPFTLSVLPWRPDSGKVLRMFCDVCSADGVPYRADTRDILKNAVRRARDAGIEFRFGTQAEFYLFRKDENGASTRCPYDEAGYLDIAPADRCENIRREISLTIERMGLTPERSYHERGPGQNEIDFHYARPLKAADQMTTFKMVVHTIADQYGLAADFSPLPLPGKPGNGYHINIFASDQEGRDVMRYAAAGILNRIREITLFLNPEDASYARLGNPLVTDRVNWSSAEEMELMYLETIRDVTCAQLRSPDASCNPYLVYALLIHAGLEGIQSRRMLPEMTDGEDAHLPGSRKDAARIAASSEFVRQFIPKEIIRVYAR